MFYKNHNNGGTNMSMKKTVYLVGVAILLIAIVGLFGCSKKDATAKQGAGVETLPTQEAKAKEEITGSKSQKEYFKEAAKAPRTWNQPWNWKRLSRRR